MGATTTTTSAHAGDIPKPTFLSADKRKISYRSKNGNLLTMELKNSKSADNIHETPKESETSKTVAVVPSDAQSRWAGLYDTLSFWVMEGVEICTFGAYDEPQPK